MNDVQSLRIGLNEQYGVLEEHLLEFKRANKGGSCVVAGPKHSGKSLVIDELLEEHFAEGPTKVIRIDGSQYPSFASTSKIFEQYGLNKYTEDEPAAVAGKIVVSKKRIKGKTKNATKLEVPAPLTSASIIIVVDHFEQFCIRQNQNFLYNILNHGQTQPWFTLLIGTKENCINLLEKRVRSRLSKNRVNFNVQFPFDEFRQGFFELLEHSAAQKDIADELKNNIEFDQLLLGWHRRLTGFCYLKKLVILFSALCPEYSGTIINSVRLIGYCMEVLLPQNEKLRRMMDSVSLRQICLLKCIFHIEENTKRAELNYREIITEYLKFTHSNDKQMVVRREVLLKDLEELVEMDLLVYVKGADLGQLEFRRVMLDVEQEMIGKCIAERGHKFPTKILGWLKTT